MKVNTASRFSFFVFAPVLITYLVPTLFLLPGGVLLALIAISDPTVPLYSAFSYNLWIIGPVILSITLFLTGRGLYFLLLHGRSPHHIWLITWIILSFMLFLALWIDMIILTSVGASETPAHIFLGMTAFLAAGLTMLSQVLLIPWLVFIDRSVCAGLPH
jgi:hypothetical protein